MAESDDGGGGLGRRMTKTVLDDLRVDLKHSIQYQIYRRASPRTRSCITSEVSESLEGGTTPSTYIEFLRLSAPTGARGVPCAQGSDNELPNSLIIRVPIHQMIRQVDNLNKAATTLLHTIAANQPRKEPENRVTVG